MSARGRRAVIKAARRKNHRLDRQTHVRSELPNLARDGDADRAGRREWRGTRRDPESNPQHAIRSPQQRVIQIACRLPNSTNCSRLTMMNRAAIWRPSALPPRAPAAARADRDGVVGQRRPFLQLRTLVSARSTC